MRLGIGSYTYSWAVGVPGHAPERPLTAFDLLDRAAALGAGVVQYCDNLPLTALQPRDVARLAAMAAQAGIAVEVGARGLDPGSLREHIRLAAAVGSSILRLVAPEPHPDDAVGDMVRRLRPHLADLRAAGVTLALENHESMPARSLAAVIEELGRDAVGACLDTANSCGAFEAPAEVIALLAPFTVNVHVKDFAMRRMWHNKGFVLEGRSAGEGDLDLAGLLDALRKAGRDPSLVVELWTPWQGTLDATIALQEEWARRSVATLRHHLAG